MRLGELTPIIAVLHVAAVMLGCVIGSFLNVVVWRVPRGESLVSPPSHCPNCGHLIRAWENIPVLSWLCLRGRCSGCRLPISVRYPLGELATGLLYGIAFHFAWRRNLPAAALPGYFFLLGALVCVAQIDMKHGVIPNLITYTGMAVAFLLALLLPSGRLIFGSDLTAPQSGSLLIRMAADAASRHWGLDATSVPLLFAGGDCLLGMLCGLVSLGVFAVPGAWLSRRFCGGRVTFLGFGDVKCLGMIGAFLGADASLHVLCAASCTGFVFGLVKKIVRWRTDDSRVVFGPFLAVAALVWMLAGRFW